MTRQLVSFDWAMKYLLRQKANFVILEGFLSELLEEDITIEEVLESESNQAIDLDKFNRVDLKVKDSQGSTMIIEVQYDSQDDFPYRILWGVSKAVTEMLDKGDSYDKINKVISVSIVYYDLGKGSDFVYHGKHQFTGRYEQDELQLSDKQQEKYKAETLTEIYPEYYIIKVNTFDDVIRDTLSEWVYFMKNETVQDDFRAKGLPEAKERLDVMNMDTGERQAYQRYIEDQRTKRSVMQTALENAREQGIEQGIEQEKRETAQRLLKLGMDVATVAEVTGLSLKEIKGLE